jgi:uncharacterized phage-associated protein
MGVKVQIYYEQLVVIAACILLWGVWLQVGRAAFAELAEMTHREVSSWDYIP